MSSSQRSKRSAGTGSLTFRADAAGRETWYGKWYVDGRQVKRAIGLKRIPSTSEGLTRPQAERELRRLMLEVRAAVPRNAAVTVAAAADSLIEARRREGIKPSTLRTYESLLSTHIAPALGDIPVHKVTRRDVEQLVSRMQAAGKSPKLVVHVLTLLHGTFRHAERKGWATSNPCEHVRRPKVADADADLKFLSQEEVEALLRAVPDDDLGRVDRVMVLTATMTGLRQGELLGLRWRDVDWTASRVRVVRNYVRGEFGTPKSKRSTRSVPIADRLAGELERHFQRSDVWRGDDDLVFANPHTGRPMDHSDLVRRFKKALKAAGVREVRWHDLRHTFGTRMAAHGVPMRTLQEWMGHRDIKTTQIYADYAPSAREAEWIEAAFAPDPVSELEAGAA